MENQTLGRPGLGKPLRCVLRRLKLEPTAHIAFPGLRGGAAGRPARGRVELALRRNATEMHIIKTYLGQ